MLKRLISYAIKMTIISQKLSFCYETKTIFNCISKTALSTTFVIKLQVKNIYLVYNHVFAKQKWKIFSMFARTISAIVMYTAENDSVIESSYIQLWSCFFVCFYQMFKYLSLNIRQIK